MVWGMFYRIKRVRGKQYLVKEWYEPGTGKKRSKSLGPVEQIEKILEWCGGWDLNPRRPTPAGPEPAPFDLARAPPRPNGWMSSPHSIGFPVSVYGADLV